jgi:hypothetical protein
MGMGGPWARVVPGLRWSWSWFGPPGPNIFTIEKKAQRKRSVFSMKYSIKP